MVNGARMLDNYLLGLSDNVGTSRKIDSRHSNHSSDGHRIIVLTMPEQSQWFTGNNGTSYYSLVDVWPSINPTNKNLATTIFSRSNALN